MDVGGLPLHMRTLPVWLGWDAACLTIAIGASAIHELAGWAQKRTGARAPALTPAAAQPQRLAV